MTPSGKKKFFKSELRAKVFAHDTFLSLHAASCKVVVKSLSELQRNVASEEDPSSIFEVRQDEEFIV